MKKMISFIGFFIFFYAKASSAYVYFGNNSSEDTMVITYKICNQLSNECGPINYTKPVAPLTAYKDEDIQLEHMQMLMVYSVQVISPAPTFTKDYLVDENGFTRCIAYENGAGLLFEAFNAQKEIFCTKGYGLRI